MQTLIRDVLTYTRASAPQLRIEPVACDDLIANVCDTLKVQIDDTEAVIETMNLPIVQGDATRLFQIFQHLISNAIKFTKKTSPHISITAVLEVREDNQQHEWIFAVKDNGIGIEDCYIEKIFVMFSRLHSHAEYSGSGIGLALCKKIIELHGGRIWFESQIGKGTTFYFSLPAVGAMQLESPPHVRKTS